MYLALLLSYVLVSFGLTFMIQYATLFDLPRNLLRGGEEEDVERNTVQSFFWKLFDCAFCVGTWSGLILGGVGFLVLQESGAQLPTVLSGTLICLSGLASATVGFFGYLVTQRWI